MLYPCAPLILFETLQSASSPHVSTAIAPASRQRPHLVGPAYPVDTVLSSLPTCPLFLVLLCLSGCPLLLFLSVVIPDDGVPGSPLYTLSPGGSPHREVSSLLCISRFPGPARISLLNARSVEANAHCSFRRGCRPGISGLYGSSAPCSLISVLSLRYPPLQMAPSSFFSSQAGNLNVTFTTDCPYFFMNN